jgi:uncharacterized phage protein gp47/JayE
MSDATLSEIIDRINTDVTQSWDGTNPTVRRSILRALVKSLAGAIKQLYGRQTLLERRLLLLTSEDDFLDAYASVFNKIRQIASNAKGSINIVGTVGTLIPAGTIFQSQTGNQYTTDADATIAAFLEAGTVNITGVTATVTISNHELASGMQIVTTSISAPSALIGTFTITVIDTDSFIFTIASPIGDGLAGSINVSASFVPANVTSTIAGSAGNQESGAQFTLLNTMPGVSSTSYVNQNGITGGADVESDDQFRDRVLYRVRNPVAHFSVQAIEDILYSIAGITRVWVLPITPSAGHVTIYYVRDNDANIIPSPADLIAVRDQIPTPAELPEANIIVDAPTPLPINFNFASITPDTQGMRTAITGALTQFFQESVAIGKKLNPINTINVNQYTKPIQTAVDTQTGQSLIDFSLTLPAGSIAVTDTELPVLGTVVFA